MLAAAPLLATVAAGADAAPACAGELLWNGVCLPPSWPPNGELNRTVVVPQYLHVNTNMYLVQGIHAAGGAWCAQRAGAARRARARRRAAPGALPEGASRPPRKLELRRGTAQHAAQAGTDEEPPWHPADSSTMQAAGHNPVNTDAARWDELGYCVFPRLFPAAEADAMRARLDADTLERPTYLGEPHTRSSGWLDVCRHPRLLDAIEACIGHDIVLVFSSFFIKPADGKDGDGNDAFVSWSVSLCLSASLPLCLPFGPKDTERRRWFHYARWFRLTRLCACAGTKTTSASPCELCFSTAVRVHGQCHICPCFWLREIS